MPTFLLHSTIKLSRAEFLEAEIRVVHAESGQDAAALQRPTAQLYCADEKAGPLARSLRLSTAKLHPVEAQKRQQRKSAEWGPVVEAADPVQDVQIDKRAEPSGIECRETTSTRG